MTPEDVLRNQKAFNVINSNPDPSVLEYLAKRTAQGASGIVDAFAGLGEGVAHSVDAPAVEASIKDFRKKKLGAFDESINRDIGQQQAFIQGDDSLKAKYNRGELSAGDVGKAVLDLGLTQLPQFAMGAGAGKLGVMVARGLGATRAVEAAGIAAKIKAGTKLSLAEEGLIKTAQTNQALGALGGNIAAMAGQETGSIYNDQAEGEKDLGKAALMGVPAGALEGISQFDLMRRGGVNALLDAGLKTGERQTWKKLGTSGLKTIAEEGGTEGAQNVLEQSGARPGYDIAGDVKKTDWEQVGENAIGGAVMGGGLHGISAPAQMLGQKMADRQEARLKEELDKQAVEAPISKAMEAAAVPTPNESVVEPNPGAPGTPQAPAVPDSPLTRALNTVAPEVVAMQAAVPDLVEKAKEIHAEIKDSTVPNTPLQAAALEELFKHPDPAVGTEVRSALETQQATTAKKDEEIAKHASTASTLQNKITTSEAKTNQTVTAAQEKLAKNETTLADLQKALSDVDSMPAKKKGATGEGKVDARKRIKTEIKAHKTQMALDRISLGGDIALANQKHDETIKAYQDHVNNTPVNDQNFDDVGVSTLTPSTEAPVGPIAQEAIVEPTPESVSLDEAAHQAASSPLNDHPEPTDAQKEAGNYIKGSLPKIHGLDISIENPEGSKRSGVSPEGKAWETEMQDHYGYIKGTVSADGDHIDTFIRPGHTNETIHDKVFVVDQIDPKTGKLDEHKVMMGYDTKEEATKAYLRNHDKTGPSRIGAITEAPIEQFKAWLKDGNTKKAFAPQPQLKPEYNISFMGTQEGYLMLKKGALAIYKAGMQIKDFVAAMIEKYGPAVNKYVRSLWDYVRKALSSERGSFSWADLHETLTHPDNNTSTVVKGKGKPATDSTFTKTFSKQFPSLFDNSDANRPQANYTKADIQATVKNLSKNKPIADLVPIQQEIARHLMADVGNILEVEKETSAKTSAKKAIPPSEYANHSGGALGSDTAWDEIGRGFGVDDHNHYWAEKKTPGGNEEISPEIYKEGVIKATAAAKAMYGLRGTIRSALIIRNWAQVKNADAVFAVTELIREGRKLNDNPADDRMTLIPQAKGGTGYAVQMAIAEGKPVYVFDQSSGQNGGQWYKNIEGRWSKSDTPVLTQNFAGIGTRNINKTGLQAIRSVYEKTFPHTEEQVAEKVVREPPANSVKKNMDETINHVMNMAMPADQNIWGADTTTLAAAEVGERTATTRSYPLGKVGEVISFGGRPHRYVITDVQEITEANAQDPAWVKGWSNKEGWTPESFNSKYGKSSTVHEGSYQTSFRLETEEEKALALKENPARTWSPNIVDASTEDEFERNRREYERNTLFKKGLDEYRSGNLSSATAEELKKLTPEERDESLRWLGNLIATQLQTEADARTYKLSAARKGGDYVLGDEEQAQLIEDNGEIANERKDFSEENSIASAAWDNVSQFFADTYGEEARRKSKDSEGYTADGLRITEEQDLEDNQFKYVVTLDRIAGRIYDAANGTSPDEPDAYTGEKLLSLAKARDIAKEKNERFIETVIKDVNSNPNFNNGDVREAARKDMIEAIGEEAFQDLVNKNGDLTRVSGLTAGDMVGDLLSGFVEAGYDVRSLYNTLRFDKEFISFKAAKDIPQALYDFVKHVEASYDTENKDQIIFEARTGLDFIMSEFRSSGADALEIADRIQSLAQDPGFRDLMKEARLSTLVNSNLVDVAKAIEFWMEQTDTAGRETTEFSRSMSSRDGQRFLEKLEYDPSQLERPQQKSVPAPGAKSWDEEQGYPYKFITSQFDGKPWTTIEMTDTKLQSPPGNPSYREQQYAAYLKEKRSAAAYVAMKHFQHAQQREQLDRQYQLLPLLTGLNQKSSDLFGVLFDAADSLGFNEDRSLTADNLLSVVMEKLNPAGKAFDKYEKEREIFSGLSGEERAKVVEAFLGSQILTDETKHGEQFQDSDEWLGTGDLPTGYVTSETHELINRSLLGIDDTEHNTLDPNRTTKPGIASLPVRNATRVELTSNGYLRTSGSSELAGFRQPSSLQEMHNKAKELIPTYKKLATVVDSLIAKRDYAYETIRLFSDLKATREALARQEVRVNDSAYIATREQAKESAKALASHAESIEKEISKRTEQLEKTITQTNKIEKDYWSGHTKYNLAAQELKEVSGMEKYIAGQRSAIEKLKKDWLKTKTDEALTDAERRTKLKEIVARAANANEKIVNTQDRLDNPVAIKLQALIKKLNYSVEGKQTKARLALMQKYFKDVNVMTNDKFEQLADDYNSHLPAVARRITPAEAFDMYLKGGADFPSFINQMNRASDTAFQDAIFTSYLHARGTEVGVRRSILTSRLSREELAAYKRLTDTMSRSEYNKVASTVPRNLLYKLEVMRELENRLLAEDHLPKPKKMVVDKDMKLEDYDREQLPIVMEEYKRRLAELLDNKKTVDGISTIADQVEFKTEFSPDEQRLRDNGHRPVTVRNEIVSGFLDRIAKIFGADYIAVVSGKGFHGRYIPVGVDGRPKIVVNMNSSKGILRVFTHELFHHAINKLSPRAYATFQSAIREAVGKDMWDNQVQLLAVRMNLNEMQTRQLLSNEFNANPKGTVVRRAGIPTDLSLVENGSDASEKDAMVSKGTELVVHLDAQMLDDASQELYSEIFSHAVKQPTFWRSLRKNLDGKNVTALLITRMASNATSVVKAIHSVDGKTENSRVISDMYKNFNDINMLLAGVVRDSLQPTDKLRSDLERAMTEAEPTFKNDFVNTWNWSKDKIMTGVVGPIEELVSKKEKTTATTPAGTIAVTTRRLSTKVEIMNAIENWINSVLDWLADHKPAGIFADYRTNEQIVALANKLLHAGNLQAAEAYHRVTKEHADVFKQYNLEQLQKIHDDVVRQKDPERAAEALKALPADVQKAFNDMDVEAQKIHDKLVAAGLLPAEQKRRFHAGQSIKWFYDNGFLDQGREVVDALKVDSHFLQTKSYKTTTEIAEGGLKAQTMDPIQMFQQYVEDAYKNIALREVLSEASTKVLTLDKKETTLGKHFASEAEARKAGFVKLDSDAGQHVASILDTGYKIINEDGTTFQKEGRDAIYPTEQQAVEAIGPHALDENSKVTVERVDTPAYRTITSYQVTREEPIQVKNKPNKSRTFVGPKPEYQEAWVQKEIVGMPRTKNEADKIIRDQGQKDGVRYTVKPVIQNVPTEIQSDMYFHPDFAKLMNTILSKDNMRNGKVFGISGAQVMNLKNTMTMLELSLSTFHVFTIGQEMVASYAGWVWRNYHMGNRQEGDSLASMFNPVKAWKTSRELNQLLDKVMKDNSYAETPEAKEAMKRLMGTDNANMVDVYQQFFNHGGMQHQDTTLRSGMHGWGKVRYSSEGHNQMSAAGKIADIGKSFIDSGYETWENLRKEHPNSKILPLSKTLLHHTLQGSTAWLMEEAIPKIKFAAFAREYTQGLMAAKDQLLTGQTTKEAIARDTMKFIEDRFGEVNWKNMWLNKSYKSALQFLFRSFTWVAGSWKALGKAGVDIMKKGWFAVKGEKYELTQKGYWGLTAVFAHMATVGAASLIYAGSAAMGSGDEQPTDEDTPLLTRLLFPRVDPYDNTKRATIPSYVSEGYKILTHLGLGESPIEVSKLVTGRFNSLLGGMVDIYNNEDFRGVSIRNQEDNLVMQAASVVKHMIPLPMSFSGIRKTYQNEGLSSAMLLSAAGIQDAPSAAKRTNAANLAFDLSRREYKGKETTQDEMDERDETKRAMVAYVKGDKSQIDALRATGKISNRQYEIALTRYPVLDNKPNPLYKDPLSQAMQRLTVKSALKVFDVMTDNEKEKHSQEIQNKINNMKARRDAPPVKQKEFIEKWNDMVGKGSQFAVSA